MKKLKTLKTLPLIGLLAMGLSLAPGVSMADDDDHGRGKSHSYQKHDSGKGHYYQQHRVHHGHSHKKHHVHRGHPHAYVHHVHRHHGHKHHVHRHHGHGHRHVQHVVVHDHHDYDPFRLMLGLHFDNIDIIYRDF